MARKANHTSEETKKSIISSFISLYEIHEIDKISISILCENAKINRGTFYYYYKDIYDLLEQIENGFINDLKSTYLSLINKDLTGNIGIGDIIKINRFIKRNKELIILFFDKRANKRIQNEIHDFIVQNSSVLFKEKLGDRTNEAHGVLEYFISGQIGIVTWWVKNNPDLSVIELLNLIYKINHTGVYTTLLNLK